LFGLLILGLCLFPLAGCDDDDNEDTTDDTAQAGQTIVVNAATPNPNGGFAELYTLAGDFHAADNPQVKAAAGSELPATGLDVGETATLRIFHFNDMHHHLIDFSGSRGDTRRLSQMVKRVNTARTHAAAGESVLWFSAGDDHIGNVFDELLGFDTESFQMSAAYQAYAGAGVDATVIGNHELDKGAAVLAQAIRQDAATLPVLSANIHGSAFLEAGDYAPAIVGVTPTGVRVGILGLTTRQETLLRTEADPELAAHDLLETVSSVLPPLAEVSDVLVILSHVGFNGEIGGMVRHELAVGDVDIAQRAGELTDKPTVVIGGHTHSLLNADGLAADNVVNGVAICQAGAGGSHLGEIEWTLSRTANGLDADMQVQAHAIKRRDDRVAADEEGYDELEHDADLDASFDQNVMAPIVAQLDERLNEVLGVAADNAELATEVTIAERYSGEITIANFMNDAVVAASADFPVGPDGSSQQVDLAVFNATGINAGITPGSEITFNDWFAVMPYADTVVIAPMTGAQIKAMVQSNAQRILRFEEIAANGGEYDPASFVSRGFLHFSAGLRYTVDLGAAVSEATATHITLLGEPIDNVLDRTYQVAINSYLANGAEGWNGEPIGVGLPEDTQPGPDLTALALNDTGLVYRNEIVAFVRETGLVGNSPPRQQLNGLLVVSKDTAVQTILQGRPPGRPCNLQLPRRRG